MADPGFPSQHTTTTTVTNTEIISNLRYDNAYLYTLEGKLKIAQIVFVLLSLIAVSFSTYSMWYQNSAVTSISMFGFWFSLFMLVFYIFHVVECFYKIPWLKIEMIFNVCWPILYILSASSAAAYTGLHFSYMISLLFGFAAMFAYGYDALLKYQAIQRGEIAQGNIAVHKQTTTSTASY
ncbi:PREDICTED: plasmolipin-like [Diuraphis noxia]|uniref:plasmolipin-like n=1 Tax=Diuraphis noxia TaxID=143948 RepID=UPI000763B304|nr:PREDICTED: plasmolipin-like [Diuraphis noxia]XP_015371615.1 PREDICTED: plasmolipin-like [Diuraphis noxia]XP_015371616.1 PREDICTED: plasmolipin-like [Diuraphis noxia]